ncbi:MAG: hypothetical protein U1F70_05690 [Candidatus Competibacteraceae bacterium]
MFRPFKTHRQWTLLFLAPPTLLGIVDSYGIELIHPIREGRSPAQIGGKGLSNHRWIVGCKLCLLINQWGEVVGWLGASAHAHDTWFQPLIQGFEDRMIILADTGFHAHEGDPPNLKLCPRGVWNDRMLIETVFSMLTLISHFKKIGHRVMDYVLARLAFTVTAFNLLIQWHGLSKPPTLPLSITQVSLPLAGGGDSLVFNTKIINWLEIFVMDGFQIGQCPLHLMQQRLQPGFFLRILQILEP